MYHIVHAYTSLGHYKYTHSKLIINLVLTDFWSLSTYFTLLHSPCELTSMPRFPHYFLTMTVYLAHNMLCYDLVKYVNLAQNSICVLHVTVLHVAIMMVWYVLLISYPLFALLDFLDYILTRCYAPKLNRSRWWPKAEILIKYYRIIYCNWRSSTIRG